MTASAQTYETPASGKYGRLLVAITGSSLVPVNCNEWNYEVGADDLDYTGFEDAGFQNGLVGVVRGEMDLMLPYQFHRTAAQPAIGMQYLVAGRFFAYELWLIHTDYSTTWGLLNRFAGVAQVIGQPVKCEAAGKTMLNVKAKSRGQIYLPNVASPSAATMLANFTNSAS